MFHDDTSYTMCFAETEYARATYTDFESSSPFPPVVPSHSTLEHPPAPYRISIHITPGNSLEMMNWFCCNVSRRVELSLPSISCLEEWPLSLIPRHERSDSFSRRRVVIESEELTSSFGSSQQLSHL